MDESPLAPPAFVVEQLIVGLNALVDVSVRIASQ